MSTRTRPSLCHENIYKINLKILFMSESTLIKLVSQKNPYVLMSIFSVTTSLRNEPQTIGAVYKMKTEVICIWRRERVKCEEHACVQKQKDTHTKHKHTHTHTRAHAHAHAHRSLIRIHTRTHTHSHTHTHTHTHTQREMIDTYTHTHTLHTRIQ